MLLNGATIKEIEYLSNDAKEALVTITDGNYKCVAFCQPCNKTIADLVKQPLLAFETKGIEKIASSSLNFNRINSTLKYEICGQVMDFEKGIVSVGLILLELSAPLPGDINVGDTIRFICERIDLLN